MTTLDLAIVVAYLAGVSGMGFFFIKSSSSEKGFTSAGGKLPGWVVGLSIFGTYLSSITFLALPGAAYAGNWNRFAFSLSLPLAAWMAVRWFTRHYRQADHVSAYAYLEERFGLWARLYASTFYLLTQFARVGTITFLVAMPLKEMAGWDMELSILATGLLVTMYAAAGGIEAVIWTDVAQSVILIAGALASAVILALYTPGGPGEIIRVAAANHKLYMGPYALSFTQATFWVTLIYGVFINLQNFGIDQTYVQRYLAARSQKEAEKSVWLGALLYIPVSALFFLIGTELFAYYGAQPGLLPAELAQKGMEDKVFPHFMVTALPMGFKGLLIAALLAAAMSTISSSINSAATILMSDIYVRLLHPRASDRSRTIFLRVASLLLGICGTGAALLMIHVKGTLDAWWKLSGVFSGGMLGLFLLGIMTRSARPVPAAVGVAVGVMVIVWATFSKEIGLPANPFHPFMTIALGTAILFMTGLGLSALAGRVGEK
jgi:SSS family solute:Na+ symporter